MSEKFPKVGVGVMILKKDRFLLGRRHSDPDKADSELHGEGTWTMPGGKLDFGEEIREALAREVFEETGAKIEKDKLELISVTNDIVEDAHFVTLGFLYKGFEGGARVMEPDEIVEWKWFKPTDPPSLMFPPSRKILEKYVKRSPLY